MEQTTYIGYEQVIKGRLYKYFKAKKIKSKKVGREYKIPKVNVIKYVMTEQ